jgi:lipoprotein-releasing system permease protein
MLLGWRYTRAGRAMRRNGFISFISAASMLGIALGVAALIIVLSVMNGFEKDVTDRMLSVIADVQVFSADGDALPDPAREITEIKRNPQVTGAAPYIDGQALLARGEAMQGAVVRGIDPAQEPQVTEVAAAIKDTLLPRLTPGGFGIILGSDLARRLGVIAGDQITLISPSGQITPAGVLPRLKQMTVLGTFNSGHYEYDSTLAMINMEDAERIFRLTGPTGIRVELRDPHRAPEVTEQLAHALGSNVLITDWTQQNRAWFSAVQIEKRMMFIILTLIVAVAAFNLVSTLVMTVQDKRANIAILRTLGAKPASIMEIFVVQGALVGVIGTLAGLLLGLLVAYNIDVIVPFLEQLFHANFLPKNVYLINTMPSDPRAHDIVPIVVVSLLLSFVATLYPSWRASRVNPAEALRYE